MNDPDLPVEGARFTALGTLDGEATLAVAGEIDIAVVDAFVAAAIGCLDEPGTTRIRLDLGGVTFLDSSGLGALVRVRNHAQSQQQGLVIANVAESVKKIFLITGLIDVLAFDE